MKKKLLFLALVFSLVIHSQSYISEIMVDPPDEDVPYEYIELRGIPNAPLTDTYLIVVEGDENDPGDLNSVHDLTGQTFGSNGYLVLLNAGHPYNVDSGANIALGLLGGANPDDGLEGQTHSFMLIQSTVAPTTNDDIDSDDDGVADGTVYDSWTILDSGVGFAKDNQNGNTPTTNNAYIYSGVAFIENDDDVTFDVVLVASAATISNSISVVEAQFEYAARIGNSTGATLTGDVTTSDWAGGNVNSNASIAADGIWQLGSSGSSVRAYPEAVEGETLDNIGSANFPNVWTGAVDSEWSTDGNWQNGEVPQFYETAVINNGLTNYPTASTAVAVTAVNMDSGTSLIANATITGEVTYKRNLPTTNWYLVSSPVGGETTEDLIANHTFATGTGSNIGVAPYTVAPAGWDYQEETSIGSLVNGKGYSVKLEAPGNVSFTGSVNAVDVNTTVINGVDSFNLIGNPFTSYVNSDSFFTDNSNFLSENTIWIWDGTQYITYNNMVPVELAPAQGFFIEASASNNLVFSVSNQSHQTDTFQKQEGVSNFELFVQNTSNTISTKVFYLEGKTTGFDNGYDSKMFGGVAIDFAVFTELVEENTGSKLAIQTLSEDDSSIVPVGLIAKAGEEITFSAVTTNLSNGGNVFLENRLTSEFVNLSETTYKTTLEQDANGIGQFYMHTTEPKILSTIEEDLNTVSIYSSSKNQLSVSGLNAEAKLSVFSLLGQEVVSKTLEAKGINTVVLPSLSVGVYVVTLKSDLGTLTKKISLE